MARKTYDVKEYRADVIGFKLEDRDDENRPEGVVTFRVFDEREVFEASASLKADDVLLALRCMTTKDCLCAFRAQRLNLDGKDVFGFMTRLELVAPANG